MTNRMEKTTLKGKEVYVNASIIGVCGWLRGEIVDENDKYVWVSGFYTDRSKWTKMNKEEAKECIIKQRGKEK